jgi:hypothetical protein
VAQWAGYYAHVEQVARQASAAADQS